MWGLREGLFECCTPASLGKPEFLQQEQHISARPRESLFDSASGELKLFFQRWDSDRHAHVRAVVFVHPGETDHAGWYNPLAVRLAGIGCTSFALDAQGFGQSDGARGYFERFEDLVTDFVAFCRHKWAEVLDTPQGRSGLRRPSLVLMGKGFGALVVMRALVELSEVVSGEGITPMVILLSPAFQFASFIGEQSNVSCGLNSQQCARQPAAQCARAPVAFTPALEDCPNQKLEYSSQWFPKMIVTRPVDPDLVSRDPQTLERMTRDALCWRQGYRARVLAEIIHEQASLIDLIAEHPDVFERVSAMILHGGGDKLFSVQGGHALHSAWCDIAQKSGSFPRFKIYDGAYHQLLNEPNKDEVMTDILRFVSSKLN